MNSLHKVKNADIIVIKTNPNKKFKNILTNEVSYAKPVSGLVGTNHLFEIFG